jgi:GNAT superfamily N-acetyltransferase
VPVIISRLKETDLDDYLAFRPEVGAADVARRLQAGHQCFVARHEGRIVRAAWAATGRVRIDFLARDLDLAPDEVYLDESHTLRRFRGHNIAAERSAQMRRHYQERGYRRSLAIVFPENRQACRAAEKSGYRPLGVMGYIKLGPWRYDFYRAHSEWTIS